MKRPKLILGSILTIAVLAGCSQNPEPQTVNTTPAATVAATPGPSATYAYDEGSKKKGDKGLCVICVVDEGATEEEIAVETISYEGKTYMFCNEAEKAVFISEPAKYATQ